MSPQSQSPLEGQNQQPGRESREPQQPPLLPDFSLHRLQIDHAAAARAQICRSILLGFVQDVTLTDSSSRHCNPNTGLSSQPLLGFARGAAATGAEPPSLIHSPKPSSRTTHLLSPNLQAESRNTLLRPRPLSTPGTIAETAAATYSSRRPTSLPESQHQNSNSQVPYAQTLAATVLSDPVSPTQLSLNPRAHHSHKRNHPKQ